MHIAPIASAMPDGRIRIDSGFLRRNPDLFRHERTDEDEYHGAWDHLEERWQSNLASLARTGDPLPMEHDLRAIGLRRAVRASGGYVRRDVRGDGYRQRSSRARR